MGEISTVPFEYLLLVDADFDQFITFGNIKFRVGDGRGGGGESILQVPNLTLILCSGSQHIVSCSVLVVNL